MGLLPNWLGIMKEIVPITGEPVRAMTIGLREKHISCPNALTFLTSNTFRILGMLSLLKFHQEKTK